MPRAGDAGLHSYVDIEPLREDELSAKLYPESGSDGSFPRPEPDCAWIHRERSRPGVTLELLHLEYLEQHPAGYQYTSFCDRYRAFQKRRGLVMRQHHLAGDKLFVDYSGKKAHLVDRATGEVTEVELFIAVLAHQTTRTRKRPTRSRCTISSAAMSARSTSSAASCARWCPTISRAE